MERKIEFLLHANIPCSAVFRDLSTSGNRYGLLYCHNRTITKDAQKNIRIIQCYFNLSTSVFFFVSLSSYSLPDPFQVNKPQYVSVQER